MPKVPGAEEGKSSALCLNCGVKYSWGSECTMSPSMGSGEPEGKALAKCTIFTLKLIWYSLLKIIKLKLSVSNKKLNIMWNMCSYVCFWFFLGQEESKGKLLKIILNL